MAQPWDVICSSLFVFGLCCGFPFLGMSIVYGLLTGKVPAWAKPIVNHLGGKMTLPIIGIDIPLFVVYPGILVLSFGILLFGKTMFEAVKEILTVITSFITFGGISATVTAALGGTLDMEPLTGMTNQEFFGRDINWILILVVLAFAGYVIWKIERFIFRLLSAGLVLLMVGAKLSYSPDQFWPVIGVILALSSAGMFIALMKRKIFRWVALGSFYSIIAFAVISSGVVHINLSRIIFPATALGGSLALSLAILLLGHTFRRSAKQLASYTATSTKGRLITLGLSSIALGFELAVITLQLINI